MNKLICDWVCRRNSSGMKIREKKLNSNKKLIIMMISIESNPRRRVDWIVSDDHHVV